MLPARHRSPRETGVSLGYSNFCAALPCHGTAERLAYLRATREVSSLPARVGDLESRRAGL